LDKRYQVFISSTFLDLRAERQAVSQALLRSDCFPAQMENWPAMDAEQMEAIKEIIDQSDYYLVISAGKYGSISPETELSYTEMEYDYAMEKGKPIIRLIHRDPLNALKGSQIESNTGAREKLEAFHAKLKTGSVCCFWDNAEQLQKETILALLDIKKRRPATGWVRGDNAISPSLLDELNTLRLEVAKQPQRETETVINFLDRKGTSDIEVKGAREDEEDAVELLRNHGVENSIIAQHVFLGLLQHDKLLNIAHDASTNLTRDFEFLDHEMDWPYYWCEIPTEIVVNCLLYLETKGLVTFKKASSGMQPDKWVATARGRKHAAYMKAMQAFE